MTGKLIVICTIISTNFFQRISKLTDLKVSSWACQFVFYKPEHNAKGGPMEWNIERMECRNEVYQRIEPKSR